jgi:hypothetical protein
MPPSSKGAMGRDISCGVRHTLWGTSLREAAQRRRLRNHRVSGVSILAGDWADRTEYSDVRHLIDFWKGEASRTGPCRPANCLVTSGMRVHVLARLPHEYVMIYAATGAVLASGFPAGAISLTGSTPQPTLPRRVLPFLPTQQTDHLFLAWKETSCRTSRGARLSAGRTGHLDSSDNLQFYRMVDCTRGPSSPY